MVGFDNTRYRVEGEHSLSHVRGCPNADLQKVAHGIHGLGKAGVGRALRPQKGLGVGLREDAGRADKVPRCQRKAGIAVVLLCGDVLYDYVGGRIKQVRKRKKKGRRT